MGYTLKQWLIIIAVAAFLILFVGVMTVPCAISLLKMIFQ